MVTKHERHIFFHIVWNCIYVHFNLFSVFSVCIILNNSSNFLHYKMAVITSQIMEDHWNFYFLWIYSEFQITVLMCGASVFASNMTMISDTNVFFSIFFITDVTCCCFFEFIFILFQSFSMVYRKMFFHSFFTVFYFF